MDPISGLITVRKGGEEFDREHVAAYFLTVVARDNLGVGNRNTVQLQVIIKDVNDNAPHFLQSRYEAKIYENELAFANPFFVEVSQLISNFSFDLYCIVDLIDDRF